ncbi:putative ABC transport system permease protein [Cribrihabitans marinus]|uniref:Putative ABC transport system permease protein n=1 Tax=Cribrihabitans marinus TaxID=1227549 RepID=A0A1H6U2V0_9RHOB|nr:ABC transporter permease [Cribrihabitans marinus]GGH21287.1 hypothetical protein GCM10010973_05790 [Cribrihabitans marinus]SEI83887.1 putative ABC transport system permease protein [Cribrihabitans marinus]
MLIVSLALRDLMRERFFLLCNIAVMVGILVPLLLLIGVKNGVYSALIGEMLSDPASRQIDTVGNATLEAGQIAPLRDWPEIAFLTPKVRGQFDYMNVRAEGGRRMRPAVMIPSGEGDPTLPPGVALGQTQVALSARLAEHLSVGAGDALQLVSQAEDRPRQLVLPVTVAAVLSATAMEGHAVLLPFELLDLIEAFYESYAMPEHGIAAGRDLALRSPSYEGIRAYVHRLDQLAPVQARIEEALGIATSARSREVEALLGLGRNLTLALGLTAGLAALGLGAALALGFWSDVVRKRATLAGIALLGLPGRRLAIFPVVQALVTALAGLILSFALYAVAARIAGRLFGDGLPGDAALTIIPPAQGAALVLGVVVLAVGASGLAAWVALRLDPATVLREAG